MPGILDGDDLFPHTPPPPLPGRVQSLRSDAEALAEAGNTEDADKLTECVSEMLWDLNKSVVDNGVRTADNLPYALLPRVWIWMAMWIWMCRSTWVPPPFTPVRSFCSSGRRKWSSCTTCSRAPSVFVSYVTPPQLATASFVEVTARADAVYPCVHVSVSGMPGRAVQQRPDSDNAADVDDVLTYSTGMPVVGVALCPFCTCGWQCIAPGRIRGVVVDALCWY